MRSTYTTDKDFGNDIYAERIWVDENHMLRVEFYHNDKLIEFGYPSGSYRVQFKRGVIVWAITADSGINNKI